MAFKMKYSPIKGVFGDFFKNIGAKKTDMGKLREKQARSSKGVSEYQHRVEESKRKRKAKRAETKRRKNDPLLGEIKDVSELKVGEGIVQGPKPKPTPESKDYYFTFSGKKGDKFKYRGRTDKNIYEGGYEFQRPGSDVWETSKTRAGTDAIHDLWVGDEKRDTEMIPIQKKSPYKKGIGKYAKKAKGSRGYKMKRNNN